MRTTSSIQFYCRNCKTDRKGFAPVEISLTINQKRTFIHLPRKERPADFLKETSKKKSEINDYLDTVRVKINQVQTELMQRGLAITAERIKEYMKSGGVKTYTVNDMYNEYMKTFGECRGIPGTCCPFPTPRTHAPICPATCSPGSPSVHTAP